MKVLNYTIYYVLIFSCLIKKIKNVPFGIPLCDEVIILLSKSTFRQINAGEIKYINVTSYFTFTQ